MSTSAIAGVRDESACSHARTDCRGIGTGSTWLGLGLVEKEVVKEVEEKEVVMAVVVWVAAMAVVGWVAVTVASAAPCRPAPARGRARATRRTGRGRPGGAARSFGRRGRALALELGRRVPAGGAACCERAQRPPPPSLIAIRLQGTHRGQLENAGHAPSVTLSRS